MLLRNCCLGCLGNNEIAILILDWLYVFQPFLDTLQVLVRTVLCCYDGLELTDCAFIIGSNTKGAIVIFNRLAKYHKKASQCEMIVVDRDGRADC
jgi:hypothetical protein